MLILLHSAGYSSHLRDCSRPEQRPGHLRGRGGKRQGAHWAVESVPGAEATIVGYLVVWTLFGQQVARYERDGWQKISLWRLAEAADALGLGLSVRARLPASSSSRSMGIG